MENQMDKVKIEVKIPENVQITHNGVIITITPFITVAKQIFLINHYMQDYFGTGADGTGYATLNAAYNLKNYLFQINTNIDTENMDNDVYVDDVLWEKITREIVNWSLFAEHLYLVVEEKKRLVALENSLGTVVSGLVLKGYSVLDKLSEITPEQIEKTRETGIELIQKLQDSSVLGAGSIKEE